MKLPKVLHKSAFQRDVCIYSGIVFIHEKEKILPSATTWMAPEGIMLSEVSSQVLTSFTPLPPSNQPNPLPLCFASTVLSLTLLCLHNANLSFKTQLGFWRLPQARLGALDLCSEVSLITHPSQPTAIHFLHDSGLRVLIPRILASV